MIFIAHRGNVNGKNQERENTVNYIEEALDQGYDCEIDIWVIDNRIFLGHDKPEALIDESFLTKNKDRLWIHCKNIEALIKYRTFFNCFFHDKDLYTITSKGYIWGNIGVKLTNDVISVMPEINNNYDFNCLGICSDNIQFYRKLYKMI